MLLVGNVLCKLPLSGVVVHAFNPYVFKVSLVYIVRDLRLHRKNLS